MRVILAVAMLAQVLGPSVVRFCAMAGMTPDRPIQKRRLRSPLHEMDGEEAHDDDELVGTPKSTSESAGPSLDAIAAIMRQELHTAISPLENQLTSMGVTFEERMGKIENTMADQDVRLSRLEQSMAADPPDTTPLSDLADKFAELQSQIDAIKGTPHSSENDMVKTMVVGGLQGCETLQTATQWLREKLQSLNVPTPSETYMKGQVFNGILFAKYPASFARDVAVATLRSAKLKHDDQQVWATQDLPIPTRARKMFLLGLRWQLGEWCFVKREVEIDDHYTKMAIAGKTVVQVSSVPGDLKVEWAHGWAAWDEFQSSAQLQQIMDRANQVLKKQGKGTGKSKSKDAGAAAYTAS